MEGEGRDGRAAWANHRSFPVCKTYSHVHLGLVHFSARSYHREPGGYMNNKNTNKQRKKEKPPRSYNGAASQTPWKPSSATFHIHQLPRLLYGRQPSVKRSISSRVR